jgi:hypothetical protein
MIRLRPFSQPPTPPNDATEAAQVARHMKGNLACPWGIFVKNGVRLQLYQGSNAGIYWALQCGNCDAPSRCGCLGAQAGLLRCHKECEAMVEALFDSGFEYDLQATLAAHLERIQTADGPSKRG